MDSSILQAYANPVEALIERIYAVSSPDLKQVMTDTTRGQFAYPGATAVPAVNRVAYGIKVVMCESCASRVLATAPARTTQPKLALRACYRCAAPMRVQLDPRVWEWLANKAGEYAGSSAELPTELSVMILTVLEDAPDVDLLTTEDDKQQYPESWTIFLETLVTALL